MSKQTPERTRIVGQLQREAAALRNMEHAFDRARERRDRTIRQASGSGLSGAEISRLTGLTEQRVGQIIRESEES